MGREREGKEGRGGGGRGLPTSLLCPSFTLDLYTRTRDIAAETFNPIPLLIVASVWYLFFTSILMIGQFFLEKRFARGVGELGRARKPSRGFEGAAMPGPSVADQDSGEKR